MTKKNLSIFPLILFLSACYIEIKENVRNPELLLRKAIKEAERAERDSFWKRRASLLNIFVYDGESRDIVRLSVPIWLFNFCIDVANDFDDGNRKNFVKHSEWDCEIDCHSLKRLSKLGPGVIMEIKDENTLILIWMR